MAKKKKGKKKKKKEFDPPVYQIPEFDDPDLVTPKVDLIIRLATFLIPDDQMTLKLNVPISTRVKQIGKSISQLHQGAIGRVKICVDKFNAEEVLPDQKTLKECGIVAEGQYKIYYDFQPVVHPVLL